MACAQVRTADMDDIEVVADVVRLARAAAPGIKAKEIFSRTRQMHPKIEEARIRRACGKAADLLLAQHS